MSAGLALQTAIYQKLNGAPGVAVPVFDYVPDQQPGNYIAIGDDTLAEFDTDETTGFDATATVHTWTANSAEEGRAACKTIMGSIYDTLHRLPLTVVGYTVAGVDQVFEQTFLDPDGVTHHGVQRFRVLMRKDEV